MGFALSVPVGYSAWGVCVEVVVDDETQCKAELIERLLDDDTAKEAP